jgi:hypothetical protein
MTDLTDDEIKLATKTFWGGATGSVEIGLRAAIDSVLAGRKKQVPQGFDAAIEAVQRWLHDNLGWTHNKRENVEAFLRAALPHLGAQQPTDPLPREVTQADVDRAVEVYSNHDDIGIRSSFRALLEDFAERRGPEGVVTTGPETRQPVAHPSRSPAPAEFLRLQASAWRALAERERREVALWRELGDICRAIAKLAAP